MAVKVVDASAIAALLFNEPQAAEMAEKLDQALLIAPALFWFEMASICLKKLALHPDKREAILQAYCLLDSFDIEPAEIDHQAVVSLAEQMGITTYDASYLWLAQTLSAELVTLDKKLLKKAAALAKSQPGNL
jgi:predicted nucleic acid-binding protein